MPNQQPPERNNEARLDRLEMLVLHLGDSHEKLLDSQKHLLYGQGVLHEEVLKLAVAQKLTEQRMQRTEQHIQDLAKEVAEAQKHTDGRINALITIVDGLIRNRPPQ